MYHVMKLPISWEVSYAFKYLNIYIFSLVGKIQDCREWITLRKLFLEPTLSGGFWICADHADVLVNWKCVSTRENWIEWEQSINYL